MGHDEFLGVGLTMSLMVDLVDVKTKVFQC